MFTGDRFTRLARLSTLLADGRLDGELRWQSRSRLRYRCMIFTETTLAGAFVIDLERREDDRGYFARAFCQNEFADHGLKPVIAQANVAFNKRRRHAPRDALPVPARARRRRSCAARVARSSTSSSTSGRRARRTSSTSRCGSTRRTAARSTSRSGSPTATRRWSTKPRRATSSASSTRRRRRADSRPTTRGSA